LTTLSIFINTKKILVPKINSRLTGIQRRFLDEMDLDMKNGIVINDELIPSPNKMQRENYVAMNLLYAIENKNDDMVSTTCNYLIHRLPELKEIYYAKKESEITMELIFNER